MYNFNVDLKNEIYYFKIRRFINEINYSVTDEPNKFLENNEINIKLARNTE